MMLSKDDRTFIMTDRSNIIRSVISNPGLLNLTLPAPYRTGILSSHGFPRIYPQKASGLPAISNLQLIINS
ncbi:hypothetical protein HC766_08255 [Candidatus Gracilibacteria bacterium]|nr:hypothetical protein [Candidatus Gracilibacteria bacterium]